MSDYRTYVTQTGFGLERDAKFNNASVDFAVLVVGEGALADAESPAAQTDLIHQVREYAITIEKDDKDPNVWIARAEIPAEDGGFTIREAGIKTGSGELYAYARQAGDYKPLLEEGQGKSYTIRLKFVPGNADTIQVKIDPSVQFATPTDLNNAVKAHEDANDPHNQYKVYADQKDTAHIEEADPHSQYLKKVENSEQLNALKQIPIYPEIMTDDNRLSISLNGMDLSIDDNQIIRLFGWLDVNTSSYENKSFVIDSSKTYHLRFDLDNGFRLLDLADISYNSDRVEHYNVRFDATYSDILVALIDVGSVKAYINVSLPLLGEIGYFETVSSYWLTSSTSVMSLPYENSFSRSFKAEVRSRAIYSSSDSVYGSSILRVDGENVDQVGRLHSGTQPGYDFNERVEHRYSFRLLRRSYVFDIYYLAEAGTPLFNVQANGSWAHYGTFSYISLGIS